MSVVDEVAFATLETLRDELGLADNSQDGRLERYDLQASAAIQAYCDREFRKEATTERLQGSGTQRLVLSRTPLVSIASVVIDGETIDADEYEIEDAAAGILYRENGWPRLDNVVAGSISRDSMAGTGKADIVVTYTGGYVLPNDTVGTRNLPVELEQACILTVTSLFRGRGRDRAVASKATGDASISYRLPNQIIGVGAGGVIPDEAVGLLAKFRRFTRVS